MKRMILSGEDNLPAVSFRIGKILKDVLATWSSLLVFFDNHLALAAIEDKPETSAVVEKEQSPVI